jgi:nucleotide-binding universal stress UspA family protein
MSGATYRHVLVPLDGSEEAETALPHAVAVASRFHSTLTLLRAAQTPSGSRATPIEAVALTVSEQQEGLRYLENIAARCPVGPAAVHTVQHAGSADDVILRHAREVDADLIVMSTLGRSGFKRLVLGSVTDEVRRQAPCPLLIVPARFTCVLPRVPTYRWIVLGLDGSRDSERALPHAVAFARAFQASIAVVRAVAPASMAGSGGGPGPHPAALLGGGRLGAGTYLARIAADLSRSVLEVRAEPTEGAAEEALARRARVLPADLVVLASPERGLIERLVLRSVGNGVLRRAVCPVLIVPHTQAANPVRDR